MSETMTLEQAIARLHEAGPTTTLRGMRAELETVIKAAENWRDLTVQVVTQVVVEHYLAQQQAQALAELDTQHAADSAALAELDGAE